ncbi:hypothetical protein ZTR_09551 [Talaromyces verruculosus]|nr:hypothetical protein ZTR_09551 [Talaromyces verruculosus]
MTSQMSNQVDGHCPVQNSLHELSDPHVQYALKCGDGLIMDSLSATLDRNFRIWQDRGFWFENCLSISVSNRTSDVFSSLHERKTQQNLRLRVSQTLFYLLFEGLKRETRQEKQRGTLENPRQQSATTFALDRLLKNAYRGEWDSMDITARNALRSKFHEFKRHGSRCWQTAGVLGLGSLLACGDTLAQVIKNRTRYPTRKLHIVLNYILNAHPGVVSIYHDFDDLMTQILRGEAITMRPAGQEFDDKLQRTVAKQAISPCLKEICQWVDPIAESRMLVEEFQHHHSSLISIFLMHVLAKIIKECINLNI